jgi:hypothetical protein
MQLDDSFIAGVQGAEEFRDIYLLIRLRLISVQHLPTFAYPRRPSFPNGQSRVTGARTNTPPITGRGSVFCPFPGLECRRST